MNEGRKQFNNELNQFVIIGKDDMWYEYQWVWGNYTSGTVYNLDQTEDYIWYEFINHKPTDDYKGNEWIMEVIMDGWFRDGITMNLRETFKWFIENNYEDLSLNKRSPEEIEMMERQRVMMDKHNKFIEELN